MILEYNKTPEGFFFFKVLVDNNRLVSKSHTHSPKNDGKSDFSLVPSYLQTFPDLSAMVPLPPITSSNGQCWSSQLPYLTLLH